MSVDNRLPTNQSQLDIVEKLDEIKDAIAQGGGGGGTGGHTIIDENGNSMTARAGLQFVGGANVDDDSTNNKTIVDLASAGGIDGVFVDTGNVIQAETHITSESTYTATEDCFVIYKCEVNNSAPLVYINNILVGGIYIASSFNGTLIQSVMLKKGQVLKLTPDGSNPSMYYSVYGIQTGTTHSKFQPVIYSLEERVIGVWKDGRPLYQKTVDFGALPNDTTKTVSYNISDLDYFVKIHCVAHNQNGSRNIPFVDDAYKSGDVLLDTIKSSGVLRIIAHTDLSSLTGDVTLQYVKTTDTAGSGTWAPQGVPAHHYSTDEQVIGTYLGETLYEKTYVSNTEISISAGNQGNNVSSLIDNLSTMAQVVNCFATNEIANGCMPLVADNSANGFVVYTFIGNSFKKLTVQYTKSS